VCEKSYGSWGTLGSWVNSGGTWKYQPGPQAPTLQGITDGTSNTIMFGEKFHFDPNFDKIPLATREYDLKMWSAWSFSGSYKAAGHVLANASVPINFTTPAAAAGQTTYAYKDQRLSAWGSGHTGGANFCMADGSVRFLPNSTQLNILQNLSTRAGGETQLE
jgi:prepilin-type processing-associated H-X9-DG protein